METAERWVRSTRESTGMLHSRATPHGKAFSQAMNEWVTKNEKK